jgi:CheY-like chemotaxis protein
VRVLLADDNAPNRNWVKQLLQLIGCQVRAAANGEEAVRLWDEWRPGMILMDLQMPVLDGFEATRRIKASPGGAETVVIALTATVLEESQRAILAAGAADLLGKPMEERLLFEKMHAHLGVNFLYETNAVAEPAGGAAGAPECPPAAVAQLPPALRAGMRDAIANGDLEGFGALLQPVSTQHPALARFLRSLAEQYDYDNLLRLLT